MDSYVLELEAPDPLGPTREEIVAAVDEATLPGERILDKKWSEYDWGATSFSSLILEATVAYGLPKGLDALLEWIKANMEQTWAKVDTEADAVTKVRDHLAEVHDAKEADFQKASGRWKRVTEACRPIRKAHFRYGRQVGALPTPRGSTTRT
jgi:hypothetical protein